MRMFTLFMVCCLASLLGARLAAAQESAGSGRGSSPSNEANDMSLSNVTTGTKGVGRQDALPGPQVSWKSVPTPEPAEGETQRIGGLVVGGLGLSGIVAGVITGVLATQENNKAKSDCQGNTCTVGSESALSSARTLGTISTVLFVAGALATVSGAVIFFTAPRSRPNGSPVIGLGFAPQGLGLSLSGQL
jgi:hypothetical protein